MGHKDESHRHASVKTIFAAFSIIVLTVITPIIFFSNNPYFFFNRFQHYQVYQYFNEGNLIELNSEFVDILDYMNLRVSELNPDFFSTRDITHMKDVRSLNVGAFLLGSIASVYLFFLFIKKEKRSLISGANRAGQFLLIMAGAILLLSVLAFERIFILFHQLLFTNDYWQLDFNTSNLIKFLPSGIFNEIFIIVSLSIIITAMSLILVSHKLNKHAT